MRDVEHGFTSTLPESLELREEPHAQRRGLVISLALPLSLALAILFWGIVGGTWTIDASQTVPESTLERIAGVRETILAVGDAPRAVSWLNEAMAPGISGTDVQAYVRSALNEVVRAKDPHLDSAETALREIMAEFGAGDHVPDAGVPTPPVLITP
ncbi:MAG: hypothetical protein JXD18_03865 [Anaerolineae bacterium]|nr:hypothetical protein [Anaerolineae bacterium]